MERYEIHMWYGTMLFWFGFLILLLLWPTQGSRLAGVILGFVIGFEAILWLFRTIYIAGQRSVK